MTKFKGIILISIFLVFTSLTLYAQEENDEKFSRHTITIESLSTYVSLLVTAYLDGIDGSDISYLTTELQYEFNLTKKLSLAARFGYKHIGWSKTDSISTFSVAPHIRFYPGENVFFIDGSVGYTNFMVNYQNPAHMVTLGTRLGWRLDFGSSKGFVLEPSFGYVHTFGRALDGAYNDDYLNDLLNWYVKQLFVGGFSFCLGMGAKF